MNDDAYRNESEKSEYEKHVERVSDWAEDGIGIITNREPLDWRTVDIETLSPIDQRLVAKFRNRAAELGIPLDQAPRDATDMFESPDQAPNI